MIDIKDLKDFINDFPYIQFPFEWKIKLVPAHSGATFRFFVKLPNGCIKSVYFDKDGTLGADTDYWEVYQIYPPDDDRRPARCRKKDIEKLLKFIEFGDE